MARLAFLQLSESAFGGILSLLLPSCSQLTYSANTQQVSLRCSLSDERRLFEKFRPWPACLDQQFNLGCERFSDNNRLFGILRAIPCGIKTQIRFDPDLWCFRGRGFGSQACSSCHSVDARMCGGTKGQAWRALRPRRGRRPLLPALPSLEAPRPSRCNMFRARVERFPISYLI